MTNGEYVTKIVEQDEDFCILTDDVAETVTIEVSLDWWNKPKTDVLDKIRAIAIKFFSIIWNYRQKRGQ